ncbi:pentapeptide repeat-containing protein, partial [Candidatus Pacearchaeota archaeon]|nr:pentapeptide repeat-containing protein [Candidatus Pacearchaeota archaeon]
LQDKNFTGSDCEDANFMISNLAGCDFTNCNLTGANFLMSNLSMATFEGANRNSHQILKFASILSDNKNAYGFLCQKKDSKIVYITEGNAKEYEWKQSTATDLGRMIYQLLVNL